MTQQFASHNASRTRGYAWHVYPDPATPGVLAGDNPFGAGDPPGPDRAPVAKPAHVVDIWLVGKNAPGIQNDHDGHSYLVLTDHLAPPEVTAGWFVEAARLREDFELEQRGDRWLRLVRIVHAADSEWGPVQDCEFQVDRA
jgi:hypothetical protein